VVLGGLGAAFALLNLDKVKVNWIVGTFRTPLIIVIVVAFVAGLAVDRVVVVRGKRKRRRRRVPAEPGDRPPFER
jgi:uncharacterized integral membrane protein